MFFFLTSLTAVLYAAYLILSHPLSCSSTFSSSTGLSLNEAGAALSVVLVAAVLPSVGPAWSRQSQQEEEETRLLTDGDGGVGVGDVGDVGDVLVVVDDTILSRFFLFFVFFFKK